MTASRLWIASMLGLALLVAPAVFADEPAPAPAAGEQPPPQLSAVDSPRQVAPVLLRIPALGVEAAVYPVGEDAEGAMDVPPDPDGVAWWSLGYGTGVPGNVVLAAHVDWDGRARVFHLLHRLESGDRIVLMDEQLREHSYDVVGSQWVQADGAPVDEIFRSSGFPELTLITCGGRYVPTERQYLDRLIVRARLV